MTKGKPNRLKRPEGWLFYDGRALWYCVDRQTLLCVADAQSENVGREVRAGQSPEPAVVVRYGVPVEKLEVGCGR